MIDRPYPFRLKKPRMSISNRAAQFSPFAALSGYEAAIQETARLTSEKIELGEDSIVQLNEQLKKVMEGLDERQKFSITYFVADGKKLGGKYVKATGEVKKIDEFERTVVMSDKTIIPIADILEIEES
ncbi:MAG: YolD-like family protein [Clostridiales bacterium]|nr:YolD-like family protein [Clostridiales bacterium]